MEKAELTSFANVIKEKLRVYLEDGKKLFTTSSFQSQSLPLLHIVSEIDNTIPVYYTNTGFLFPETLQFVDSVTTLLNLNVVALRPEVTKIRQMDHQGRFLYTSDPDHCCYLNKVAPLDPVLIENDIWVNGIRADQSAVRSGMSEEQPANHNCLRYHPMLQWNAKMVYYYRKHFDLPEHPLEKQGYLSIGCEPCTSKHFGEGNQRNARWFGMNKTECGLNTTLVETQSNNA